MRVTIAGKRWMLKFVPRRQRKWRGLCRYDISTIQIEEGQSQVQELDTVIHEVLHASLPPIDETYVAETATDIARILMRLGWQKQS